MSIAPTCDVCYAELREFGAILLSPPDKNDMVRKDHICTTCYRIFAGLVRQVVNGREIAKLKRELSQAGDRRDWDGCIRLEKELDTLQGIEPEENDEEDEEDT